RKYRITGIFGAGYLWGRLEHTKLAGDTTSIYIFIFVCYALSSFVRLCRSLPKCMVPLVYSALVWSRLKFCLMMFERAACFIL
uniref:Uncharacterized protein n=1 Tax=Aegilops tauschii subsp. strangulata TaxID=200361 RepID=A0A453JKP9_AEGTS